MDKKCFVYVHINKINGKKYVGITSKPRPENRWEGGNGYKENTHFYAAIQKYGWDGFEHIILFYGMTWQDAIDIEKYLISYWHTQDNRYGYNMTSGGEGTPNCHPSEETRKKLSDAKRKENLSAETLKRRSDGLKGRKFTQTHKDRIGKSNSKAIEMLDLDGRVLRSFPSAQDAERNTGINHSHISQCCNFHRNTTGGYKWRFA